MAVAARQLIVAVACAVASGCAASRPLLPAGPGAPFPGIAEAYAQAVAECRGVTSITASLGLSGRTGSQKLRGRIDAGLEAPGRIRLEGFPPVLYGSKPFFVLVATGDAATLVLPRDGRVLRGARPAEIVEALAGVPLGPADLQAVIAGCGLVPGTPGEGRLYDNNWAALDQGDATIYLQQVAGQWRVAAAARGAMTIQYRDFAAGRPQTIGIRMAEPGRDASADITLKLSDVERNVPFEDRVFEVDVPAAAVPLTLDELRRSGPLGEDRK